MFIYSWFYSALMGNRNIVRVSNSASATALLLCDALNQVLASSPDAIRRSLAIVQYGHEAEITGAFSAHCDVRIIWGGDETVRSIRAIPLAPRATELVFADRYSLSLIRATALLQADDTAVQRLAEQFYNDLFWFDQMACSSPRLLVWQGTPADAHAAAERLLGRLADVVTQKAYRAETATRINRFTFACRAVLDGPVSHYERHEGRLDTLWLTDLTDFCREHCGGGLLYQYATESLEPLAGFVDRRDQTVTHFGFSAEELPDLVHQLASRGVDRVVPVGKALQFDRYWDGYDLFLELTRHIHVAAA
jgi:hypothetical protein